jgi:signal peptidase I
MADSAEASGRADSKPAPAKPAVPERNAGQWFSDLVRTWAPPILAVLVIRAFIFEPFRIPSGSMVPTLEVGDMVFVTKYSYGLYLPWIRTELLDLADPKRGDIIVFRYPLDESQNYIKRVVGIPGDRITVRNNMVYLNDELQPWVATADAHPFVDDACNVTLTQRHTETLDGVAHSVLVNSGAFGMLRNTPEFVVPEGNVFVMGDNRDNSADSRQWGFVRFDQIKGKAQAVLFSVDMCAGMPPRLRMDRVGKGLYGVD